MPLDHDKSTDFANWYSEIVMKAEIVDNRTPIKGANVLLPNGYGIWENIQRILDAELKATGHNNMYFPLFVPEELLNKEAEHFSGFAPEVAWVTHVGDKKLDRKVGLRPTSEAIMYTMFALWIRSHTDLPLKVNQWCNIIRWDTKETKVLLRDREFLWHEGHTAHATYDEAVKQVEESMRIYEKLFHDLCLSYIIVKRPRHDTFPGADYSIAYDSPLPDGRVLQIGTTHNLGQNFSKAFNVRFQKADGEHEFVYQTSYGVSTRVIAAVLSMHGDNKGAIIPPKVALTQAIVIPIYFKGKHDPVNKATNEIVAELKEQGIRVKADLRDNYTSGWKFNQYELLGVPLRIEVGPRDVEKNQAVLVRRDNGQKITVSREELTQKVKEALEAVENGLRERAWKRLEEVTSEAKTLDELEEIYSDKKGIIRTNWCGDEKCSDQLKERIAVEIRGTKLGEEEEVFASCVICGNEAKEVVYVASAY